MTLAALRRIHLSEEVARLVGQSEKLKSLVAERQQVQSQLAELERGRSAEAARVIAPVDVTAHQQRLATLRTAKGELDALATDTAEGTRIRIPRVRRGIGRQVGRRGIAPTLCIAAYAMIWRRRSGLCRWAMR